MMTGFLIFTCIAVVIGVVAFMLFTPYGAQLSIKMKGRADVIAEQDASTAEGAKDYYAAIIREKENNYQNAIEAYSTITGKIEIKEKDLIAQKKEIMKINQSLNKCIDEGRDDDALHYITKKQNIESKVEILKENISDLKTMKEEKKETMERLEKELNDLKVEKEKNVYAMEAQEEMDDMRKGLASSVSTNETDRMLEKVREGARKSREKAEGSKIVYESSTQTKEYRIEKKERDDEAKRALEELKKQRGKA